MLVPPMFALAGFSSHWAYEAMPVPALTNQSVSSSGEPTPAPLLMMPVAVSVTSALTQTSVTKSPSRGAPTWLLQMVARAPPASRIGWATTTAARGPGAKGRRGPPVAPPGGGGAGAAVGAAGDGVAAAVAAADVRGADEGARGVGAEGVADDLAADADRAADAEQDAIVKVDLDAGQRHGVGGAQEGVDADGIAASHDVAALGEDARVVVVRGGREDAVTDCAEDAAGVGAGLGDAIGHRRWRHRGQGHRREERGGEQCKSGFHVLTDDGAGPSDAAPAAPGISVLEQTRPRCAEHETWLEKQRKEKGRKGKVAFFFA